MMKQTSIRRKMIGVGLATLILLILFGPGAVLGRQAHADVLTATPLNQQIFNIHLDTPHGSRIDYLRINYYDTSAANSIAFVTTYDSEGGIVDRTSVSSSGTTGYGTALSPFLSHIVDTENNSYVLNWRSNQLGPTMRLCGLRVAYRLPEGAGWSSTFYYINVAGATLRPRDGSANWDYAGAGCLYQSLDRVHLPLTVKRR